MLVDGQWQGAWTPVEKADADGRFLRPTSTFRGWLTADGRPGPEGQPGFRAEPGRYRLYVALTCPWASRVLMVRKLKKLDTVLPVSVVNPELGEQGWRFGGFPGADLDPLHGAAWMHEIYTRAAARYTGRATVPVLWDTHEHTIVSNESADLVAMLDDAFDGQVAATPTLRPRDLLARMEALHGPLYERFNNGVYRAGFAGSQAAYEEAVTGVFETLDELESRLVRGGPFMFGERLTETDLRAFVTAVRFDLAYHGLFKCNLRRLADYPALDAWLARVYALPGVAETVNVEHIKRGYYSIRALNPSGIVPLGPLFTPRGQARSPARELRR